MTSKKTRTDNGGTASARGAIGLGDLMRALKGLDTSAPGTVERIARSLGFGGMDANPVGDVKGVSGTRSRPRLSDKTPAPQRPHQPIPQTTELPGELPNRIHDITLTTIDLPPPATEMPDWLNEPVFAEAAPLPAARASLFPARSVKGVLTASIATRRPGHELDMPVLIRSLVRGASLSDIPYRPRPSLHHGVQLLMDTGESMMPFLEDLDDLADELTALVGKANYQSFEFDGDPNGAVGWTEGFNEVGWRPVPNRPIVLATDFGIGAHTAAHKRVSTQTWGQFLAQAGDHGSPVVAFVPYGRERWPRSLTRVAHFIHWDPHTRASSIKKLFGIGHEVDG